MDNSKNMWLAIVLSMITILAWQYFYVKPHREALEKYNIEHGLVKPQQADAPLPDSATSNSENGFIDPETLVNESAREQGRVDIDNGKIKGSLSLQGGQLDDLVLNEYREKLDPESPAIRLLSPKGSKHVNLVRFGWNSEGGIAVPDAEKTLWQQDSTNKNKIFWNNGNGLEFSREISVDENYMITVTDVVKNNGDNSVKITPFGYINRANADEKSAAVSHEGPMAVIGGTLHEISYKDAEDEKDIDMGSGMGWAGIGDKYWLTAIIPPQNANINVKTRHYVSSDNLKRFQLDYAGSPIEIAPDGVVEYTRYVFAGAKKLNLLDKYKETLGIKLFDRSVDFGRLYFITRPLFELLHYYFGILGNFGLAIMLLTITVKACLFPLAYKSYEAMAKMKKLTPELNALKERYKDDKMQMQQQIIAFYKERKINPAAGCLPLLVQIPIFFSLYKVLYITIEMRHAPFYGYIKDLSAPDPLNIFNLFGLINWTPPAFLPVIGLLPLAFMISMFIQQRLSPPPADPNYQVMMKWLPVIFLFLFAGFASGLVLYWTWSNVLTIIQQFVITRKVNAKHG